MLEKSTTRKLWGLKRLVEQTFLNTTVVRTVVTDGHKMLNAAAMAIMELDVSFRFVHWLGANMIMEIF